MLEPLAANELSGVEPPTAPLIVTVAPVPPTKERAWAPLIVVENVIAAPAGVDPLFVASIATAPVSAAGPVIETAPPLVVRLPPKLIAVEPV